MPDGTPNPLGETFSVGQRIAGRYLLKRALGRGGMSVVWLAWDSKVEHEVALKFLSEELWGDKAALERLRLETKHSLQLTHPNIVRIYDFIHEPRHAAIAMEFVDGWSLWALRVDRSHKRYRTEEIIPWIRQLCGALDYAHNRVGIVHCDLKPSNLMLDRREQLKITDFGLAQRIRGINLRTENLIIGTDGFISPQRAQGVEISPLDDIYSLGATIFDLLTGSPPFQNIEDADDLSKWRAPRMSERLPEGDLEEKVPAVWEETVAACLDPDPAQRPQSAMEVLKLLEQLEIQKPVEPTTISDESKSGIVESNEAAGSISPTLESERESKVVDALPGAMPVQFALPTKLTQRKTIFYAVVIVILIAAILFAVKLKQNSDLAGAGQLGFGKNRQADSAGTLDPSFSVGEGANREIRSVVIQSDGKFLVGGLFDDFSGSSIKHFVRLAQNGSIDKTFVPQPNGGVHAIAIQPDGKIIAGGEFQSVQREARRRVARFYDDGSLDPTFSPALNREVRAIVVQPDGKIILAGSFDIMTGKRQHRIVRLNPDGKRDESFNVGTGAPLVVWALALQPDGKILVAGDFTSFDGKPFARIVRLESDGSIDKKFDPGDGANATVFAVNVQTDGKILIGGDFIQVHGVERNHIARLNSDGSVDVKFSPGVGPNAGIRCLAIQPDGKILLGGIFTSVQGVPRIRVARLKTSGAVDLGFDPGEGANEVVRWIGQQADGKILMAGGFKKFDGMDVGRIARINSGLKKTEK